MKRVIVQSEFLVSQWASYEAEARDSLKAGERVIIFDLSRVKFIDSDAVRMLKLLSEEAEGCDAVILLDNLSQVAEDFVALLNLDQLFYRRSPAKRIDPSLAR